MPIQYALFENNLTSDPDDYMALVQPIGTADLDVIIDRMIQQGSTVFGAKMLNTTLVFPTPVGVNRNTVRRYGVSGRIPHTRGGEPK